MVRQPTVLLQPQLANLLKTVLTSSVPDPVTRRPWTLDQCRRMGGYVTRYAGGLDFLTIRGTCTARMLALSGGRICD